jgi:hypothetical protein
LSPEAPRAGEPVLSQVAQWLVEVDDGCDG